MSQFARGWSPLPSGNPTTPGIFRAPDDAPGPVSVVCGPNGPILAYAYTDPAGMFGPILAGPFATYGEGYKWIDAHPGACNPAFTPPPSSPPSQPPTGPAPPPPPPPTPTTSNYFNVCYDTGGGGRGIVQKLADTGSVAMGQVSGALAAFGPYAGRVAAENNADGDLKSCVGSHPLPPDVPVASCKIDTDLWVAIPEPGSEAWCLAQDSIFAAIKKLGLTIISLVEGGLNAVDDWLLALANTKLPDSCGVTNLLSCFWSYLKSYGSYIPERVVCGLKWVVAVIKNGLVRPATCDTTTYVSIVAVKAFWNFCKNADIGSDVYVLLHTKYGEPIPLIDRVLDYLLEYACPTHVPWIHEAIEASLQGELTERQYECWMRMHGASPGVWEAVRRSRRPRLTEGELIRWSRQFTGADDVADKDLVAQGWIDDEERQAKITLYDELPSIGDHLEFLRKNVFDDAYVAHFRLMEGFEERFWSKFGGQLRALGMTKETAGLHYAAHWINPSFTQQFEMVQRLRPGRVDPAIEFTRDDLLRTMAEMDVGVYFRERLERVSHPVPNLTLVLQMYQFGTVDDVEFVEKLKDLGFDDDNAQQILGSQIIKVRRLNASSGHGWTPAAMAPAYAVGKLTAEQVYAEMTYLGYSRDDGDRLMRRAETELSTSPIRRIQQVSIRAALTTQENAYKCGAITAEQLLGVYANAGIPKNVAEIATANVDSAIAVGLCGKQVQTFRGALLKGKATVDQIRGMMLGSGIPPLRVQQYLASWVIEAQLKGPSATAAQILRWVGTGLLDSDTAAARLRNLGWTNPDLTLLLAESSAKLARYQQQIQRQAAKSQQSAAKAALSLAREAETTAKRLRSQLRGIASIATLQKWVKDGLMDEATFLDYAQARGYDLPDAERYLADALLKASAAKKPPEPKTVPGVQSNGPAAQTPTAQP